MQDEEWLACQGKAQSKAKLFEGREPSKEEERRKGGKERVRKSVTGPEDGRAERQN